jgi:hypothetical protein
VWQDYHPVAELMAGIVAEASGAGIQKEVQQTIDAVATATADLAADEGATADKIAKLLRLDRSSAWRRLRKAALEGFIVNLETRRGQPGRYRVTSQEVELEDLLPSPEALADPYLYGDDATVQSARQVPENDQQIGCLGNCNRLQPAESPDPGCVPGASPHATANHRKDNGKAPSVARLQGFHGGEEEGPSDGDPFTGLKRSKWGLAHPDD